MRALEYVQPWVICTKGAVQSHHPAPLNVTQEHAPNLEPLLGAVVWLRCAAGQGNLTSSGCWVWVGARLPHVLYLWWRFLLCLHMGIGLSSLGILYSSEALIHSLQIDPTLLGLWLCQRVLGSGGNEPVVLEKQ